MDSRIYSDELKDLAKSLIEDGNMNQKEAAKLLNVNVSTINDWVKKYGWKYKNDRLYSTLNEQVMKSPFAEYLFKKDRSLYKKLGRHLNHFLFLNPQN